MRVLSERQLAIALGALPGIPRVVAGGNFATPWRALAVLDGDGRAVPAVRAERAGRDAGPGGRDV